MFSVDLISLLDNIHSCNFKETNYYECFFNWENLFPSLEYFFLIANRDLFLFHEFYNHCLYY